MSKVEKRLDAVTKLLQTGMKMLVQMQEEHREFRRENRDVQRETREAIRALIEAQTRTDAKLDRLVAALLRARPNGR